MIGDINTADAGITAAVNSAGTGIQLTDTTGGTASNLIVADGDSTSTAEALGLATGAAGTTATNVDSGDLHLQVISRNTTLASMNGGAGVALGSLKITDTAGNTATLNVTSSMTTVGDVIDAINRLGTQVTAAINATGDGISLTDNAAGSGTLSVVAGSSTTASDLHLLGPETIPTGSSQQVIDGSTAESITLKSTDALAIWPPRSTPLTRAVTASVFTQSSGGAARLSLVSTNSGTAGAIVLDTSQLNLSMTQTVAAQNAVLSFGSGTGTTSNVTVSSSSNNFTNVLSGVSLQVDAPSSTPVTVSIANSDSNVVSSVQSLVTDYNNFRTQLTTLTAYNTSTNSGAALFADGTALAMDSDLSAS